MPSKDVQPWHVLDQSLLCTKDSEDQIRLGPGLSESLLDIIKAQSIAFFTQQLICGV